MYEVKAYHCSYCSRYKLTKSVIVEHEKRCFRNPATQSCATCLFYDREDKQDGLLLFSNVICHKGVKFYDKEPQSAFEHIKPNLKSGCPMWIERPDDEEEKINLLYDHGCTPAENFFRKAIPEEIDEIDTEPAF